MTDEVAMLLGWRAWLDVGCVAVTPTSILPPLSMHITVLIS
jgi:hypothetical protein